MIALLRGAAALALAVAAGAFTTYLPAIAGFFDFFLVVSVYYAMTTNQVRGMFIGAACGLVQDALSVHLLGINAFPKALLGSLIGGLGTRFVLSQRVPQMLVLAAATVFQSFLQFALHLILGLSVEPPAIRRVLPAVLGNMLLGAAVYSIIGWRAEKSR